MSESLPVLRIFVSSPGDVAPERESAYRVIRRLRDQYADEVRIEPYLWEYEPLPATETYQASIPYTSEMDVVVCILWSRMGTPIREPEPFDSGTEFEIVHAFRGYRESENCRPTLLVYRKTAPAPTIGKSPGELAEAATQKAKLDAFMRRWFVTDDNRPAGATSTFLTPSQFEALLSNHIGRVVESHVRSGRKSYWHGGTPYRGLGVFDVFDEPIYFGREADIHRILGQLETQAAKDPSDRRLFVLILGRSGSGKSSLARAGITARLLVNPDVISATSSCRYAIARPGVSSGLDPFAKLVESLAAPDAFPGLANVPDLALRLRDDPSSAIRLICQHIQAETAAAADQPKVGLILVVDQMEELCADGDTQDRSTTHWTDPNDGMIAEYLTIVHMLARSGVVCVVATLRSDFYDRLCRFQTFTWLKEGPGQYDLQPPDVSEIGQIIRRPALAVSMKVDDALETELRDEVSRNRDCLPLLEYMLSELYDATIARSATLLGMEDYRAKGGLSGVIAHGAENAFRRLSESAKASFGRVARRLVAVPDDDAGELYLRRVCQLSEFHGDPPAQEFIRVFTEARLLATDSITVEVSHESLLTNWTKFRDWIAEHREALRLRSKIERSSQQWIDGGRAKELLLADDRQVREGLRALEAEVLTVDQRQFVEASQAKRRLARGIATTVLSVLGILAVVVVGVVIYQQFREGVLRSTRLANVRMLQDVSLDRERLGDTGASAVLLAKALQEAEGLDQELEDALRVSITLAKSRLLPLERISSIRGETRGCAVSPDGLTAVVGAADGRVWTIGLENGSVTELYRTGEHEKLDAITDVDFDPSGRRVAVATVRGSIHLVPLDGDASILLHKGQSLTARFNSTGSQLLVAGRNVDKTLHPNPDYLAVYDCATLELVRRLPVDFDLYAADFSADDRYIAAGGGDGAGRPPRSRLMVFDTASDSEAPRHLPQPSRVFTVTSHPTDPNKFATGDVNGEVRFWDLSRPTGSEQDGPEIRHERQVRVATFSSDGSLILVGGEDGSARVWDVDSRSPASQRMDHRGQVRGGAIAGKVITVDYVDGVRLWDRTPRAPESRVLWHPSPVWEARFDETGERVITGCASDFDNGILVPGAARVWRVDEDRPPILLEHGADVMAACFRPNSSEAVSCGNDGTIFFWDSSSGKKTGEAPAADTRVLYTASYNADGTRLACGGFGKIIRLFEGSNPGPLLESSPVEKDVHSFVWNVQFRDATLFADGGAYIRRWQLSKEPAFVDRAGKTDQDKVEYWQAAIDSLGSRALAVASDGRAYVFNFDEDADPAPLGDIRVDQGRPYAAWSLGNDTIAIGGADGAVRLWARESDDWSLQHTMRHPSAVESLAFSPDGNWLVTGCRDGGVRMWSTPSGLWSGAAWHHNGPITRLEFSPNGDFVLSASRDGTARLVPFPAPDSSNPDSLMADMEADAGVVMNLDTDARSANVAAALPISAQQLEARRGSGIDATSPSRDGPK